MRHVKVKLGVDLDDGSLDALIRAAYADIKRRLAMEQSVGMAASLRKRAGPARRPTRS
jgi:hypothetical protein